MGTPTQNWPKKFSDCPVAGHFTLFGARAVQAARAKDWHRIVTREWGCSMVHLDHFTALKQDRLTNGGDQKVSEE